MDEGDESWGEDMDGGDDDAEMPTQSEILAADLGPQASFRQARAIPCKMTRSVLYIKLKHLLTFPSSRPRRRHSRSTAHPPPRQHAA